MKRGPTSFLASMVGRVVNSALENPNIPITPEQLVGVLGGGPTYAGPHVNERSAMRSSAVWACVALVSGLKAGLPLRVYKGVQGGDRVPAPDHKLQPFLYGVAHPELTLSSFNWQELDGVHQMLWGNHYSYIDKTNGGDVLGFIPLAPDRTQVGLRKTGLGFSRFYRTTLLDASSYDLTAKEVIHVAGLGFDGLKGISVIQHMARQAIGSNLAMEEASARILATGARISGVVTMPAGKSLSVLARDELKADFRSLYQGSFNAGEVAFLDNGMTFTSNQMTLKDAELLEARRFSVADIARGFGVPPFFIGEMADMTAWGSGLEQVMLVFLMTGLDRWLKRTEAEINLKLFAGTGYFVEYEREALHAMNITSRMDAINKTLSAGGSINQALTKMGLPRAMAPGADEPMVSNNVRPLSQLMSGAALPNPPKGTEP